ncbi:hypothetical protein D9M69_451440 [compost metagenome]
MARLGQRRAIQPVQLGEGQGAGGVEREFGQFGDRAGHHLERGVLLAVEHHQALQHQLAQHAQGRGHGQTALQQLRQAGLHAGVHRCAERQAGEFVGVAAAHALHETRVFGDPVSGCQGRVVGGRGYHIH